MLGNFPVANLSRSLDFRRQGGVDCCPQMLGMSLRFFHFSNDPLKIFPMPGPKTFIRELRQGSRFASIHMGSSRYFEPQELEVVSEGEDLAPLLRREGRARTERSWRVPGA